MYRQQRTVAINRWMRRQYTDVYETFDLGPVSMRWSRPVRLRPPFKLPQRHGDVFERVRVPWDTTLSLIVDGEQMGLKVPLIGGIKNRIHIPMFLFGSSSKIVPTFSPPVDVCYFYQCCIRDEYITRVMLPRFLYIKSMDIVLPKQSDTPLRSSRAMRRHLNMEQHREVCNRIVRVPQERQMRRVHNQILYNPGRYPGVKYLDALASAS